MKYLINFTIDIEYSNGNTTKEMTSYSILENDIVDENFSDLDDVKLWFNGYFSKNPIDFFIDTSKLLSNDYKVNIKIGRVTETLSGKYKTY